MELHVGMGMASLSNTGVNPNTLAAGGTLWLNQRVGVGAQHVAGLGTTLAPQLVGTPVRRGVRRLSYTTMTARFRWLDGDLQIEVGVGAMSRRIERIERGGPGQAAWYEEGPRSGLAVDAFVSRHLFRGVGVKGGVAVGTAGLDSEVYTHILGLVSIGL